MHMDPLMPTLVGTALAILLVGLVLRRFRQPHVIAYLVAGAVIGPHGAAVFTDEHAVARVGEFGVVLLLFFVGMEVSVPRLVSNWRVTVFGTALQIGFTVLCVAALGWGLDWPTSRIVLLGFALSLSSTAVVVSVLRAWGELDTESGQDALGILLVQDVAIIPMLITLGFLAGDTPTGGQVLRQVVGAAAVLSILGVLARHETVRLPLGSLLKGDRELQVFAAAVICFGLAFTTALLGLSTALGAFVAGVVVAAAKETDWVHHSLESFRVIFVALFFVSIGMLIDLDFLADHWRVMFALVAVAFVTNTAINAGLLRLLGRSWSSALYVGGLLAQIGEFSFVIAAVGHQSGIITDYAYQGTIIVIALSLLVSPAWIVAMRRLGRRLAPPDAVAG